MGSVMEVVVMLMKVKEGKDGDGSGWVMLDRLEHP